MKAFGLYIFLAVVCLSLAGCSNEPTLFGAKVTAQVKSLDLANGQQLEVTAVTVSDAYISKGEDGEHETVTDYKVERVDFFIANRKIGSSDEAPFAFNYILSDLPAGEHQLRVDAVVSGISKRVQRDKYDVPGMHRARVGVTYPLIIKP